MSAAQALIIVIDLCASSGIFVLMRFPQHRRVEYRGRPLSMTTSVVAAAIILAICLVFAWAQVQYESR